MLLGQILISRLELFGFHSADAYVLYLYVNYYTKIKVVAVQLYYTVFITFTITFRYIANKFKITIFIILNILHFSVISSSNSLWKCCYSIRITENLIVPRLAALSPRNIVLILNVWFSGLIRDL